MTKKRIEIKVNKELYNAIEKYRKNKKYEDKQDLIVEILERKFTKGFFYRLKNLFLKK